MQSLLFLLLEILKAVLLSFISPAMQYKLVFSWLRTYKLNLNFVLICIRVRKKKNSSCFTKNSLKQVMVTYTLSFLGGRENTFRGMYDRSWTKNRKLTENSRQGT